jgi:hypothetical protein
MTDPSWPPAERHGGPPTVTLEYALEAGEWVDAQMLIARLRLRRGRLTFGLLGAAAAFVALLAIGRWPAQSFAMCVVAGVCVVFSLYARERFRRQILAVWHYTPHLGEHVRLSLGPDGVFSESAGGQSFIRWHVFTHYTDAPAAFLLFRGPATVVIVPKRAMARPQLEACHRWLQENIFHTELAARDRGFPVGVKTRPRPSPVEMLEERQPPGA